MPILTVKQDQPQASNILVNFHIGRGGRFYNAGHVTFKGEGFKDKRYIESCNFFGFENEDQLCNDYDGVLDVDVIRERIYRLYDKGVDAPEYKEFCDEFGDLGKLQLVESGGNTLGDYLGVDVPYHYDYDGAYNTYYGKWIEECSEAEIEIIKKSNSTKSPELLKWLENN